MARNMALDFVQVTSISTGDTASMMVVVTHIELLCDILSMNELAYSLDSCLDIPLAWIYD